jgi:hypothetical protein
MMRENAIVLLGERSIAGSNAPGVDTITYCVNSGGGTRFEKVEPFYRDRKTLNEKFGVDLTEFIFDYTVKTMPDDLYTCLNYLENRNSCWHYKKLTSTKKNWAAKRYLSDINFILTTSGAPGLSHIDRHVNPRRELLKIKSEIPKFTGGMTVKRISYNLDKEKSLYLETRSEMTRKQRKLVSLRNYTLGRHAEQKSSKLTKEIMRDFTVLDQGQPQPNRPSYKSMLLKAADADKQKVAAKGFSRVFKNASRQIVANKFMYEREILKGEIKSLWKKSQVSIRDKVYVKEKSTDAKLFNYYDVLSKYKKEEPDDETIKQSIILAQTLKVSNRKKRFVAKQLTTGGKFDAKYLELLKEKQGQTAVLEPILKMDYDYCREKIIEDCFKEETKTVTFCFKRYKNVPHYVDKKKLTKYQKYRLRKNIEWIVSRRLTGKKRNRESADVNNFVLVCCKKKRRQGFSNTKRLINMRKTFKIFSDRLWKKKMSESVDIVVKKRQGEKVEAENKAIAKEKSSSLAPKINKDTRKCAEPYFDSGAYWDKKVDKTNPPNYVERRLDKPVAVETNEHVFPLIYKKYLYLEAGAPILSSKYYADHDNYTVRLVKTLDPEKMYTLVLTD